MELLSVNWGNTLVVVGFGFGIVFTLLVMLVFLLTLWQKLMAKPAPQIVQTVAQNQKSLAHKAKPSAYKKPSGSHNGDNQNLDDIAIAVAIAAYKNNLDFVAIAVALQMHFGNAHDVETAVLTIKPRTSTWNAKFQLMNNLKR
jgi:hypothetical protein